MRNSLLLAAALTGLAATAALPRAADAAPPTASNQRTVTKKLAVRG
jgi:hypothetical protein